MKKKIMHLITGLEVGGAENMLLKILPRTADTCDHSVCSIIGVGPIGDKLVAAGIPVYYLDLSNTLDLSIIPKLKKLIVDLQPDVLITYLPHADLLGRIIGKLTHVPTIVCSVRVRLTRSKYLPYFIIDGLTSPLVNKYHFNSRTIANLHRLILRVPRRKITVIPNTIDVDLYHLTIDREAKKKELGLPADKIIIGCVARLRKQKGHNDLIAAFHSVHSARPNTTLVLVGDGEEKPDIMEAIKKYGLENHVIMLGNRHDVPEILQTFDIFAFTTLYEGMSNSLMEAMSARLPILTTNIPENRELITNDQTGVLVPVHDIRTIANALVRLIDDPPLRHTLAANAYQQVKDHFSIKAIIPQYIEFYRQL
ncbi:MAG: hypothetical protein A3E37_04970 [Candidatus Andersenbacteria bacterium RIFCSPHIGHO2_12_FULL_46_9]|nr:MAG: Glycosyl transferase group 1 [Parcubacteria group bacterium GW2011_GWA2_45_14]OGY33770.1 MAG: hypothetical protein A3B76_02825 [Candidatus Andersenbacteria bacterium RIFCSPHIGHO2_02_FULL_46_16]OGY36205.1 MAG: hypothetical protein A3I08_05145 [Candidatus Andersenbacteria bacterium RIFCSPLOWO2_02_FULL_46_11]OGY36960.1 MAG: hypothetical protein A3E37_04970 [Candidatus Andersenbacteria bacterium RIFCSPHIGHO2_12_FULL_46_9]HBE89858.1 hypothetical protein [Candidatus Andersenbacteria bacterium